MASSSIAMGNPHTGRNSRRRLTMRANTIWPEGYARRQAATMRISAPEPGGSRDLRHALLGAHLFKKCSAQRAFYAASGSDRVRIHAVSKKFVDLLGVSRRDVRTGGIFEHRRRAAAGKAHCAGGRQRRLCEIAAGDGGQRRRPDRADLAGGGLRRDRRPRSRWRHAAQEFPRLHPEGRKPRGRTRSRWCTWRVTGCNWRARTISCRSIPRSTAIPTCRSRRCGSATTSGNSPRCR